MITSDGWLDWAIRLPAPLNKTNPGINPVKGIFLHSAEGYATHLLDLAVNGPYSWHISSMLDGRLYQHYPFSARCLHATAANNSYVGMENEGYTPNEPTLSPIQVANARRVISDLSTKYGWTPKRPTSPADISHTLWEHNEVARLGGAGTACPSGRIPWDLILQEPPMPNPDFGIRAEPPFVYIDVQGIGVIRIGDAGSQFPGQIAKLYGDTWYWLRKGQPGPSGEAPAFWSPNPGD